MAETDGQIETEKETKNEEKEAQDRQDIQTATDKKFRKIDRQRQQNKEQE
jgi:hypothetical protein